MHADLEYEALLKRLRELPPGPPPYGWREFQRRAQPRRLRQPRTARSAGPALLAGAVLILAFVALLARFGGPAPHALPTAESTAAPQASAPSAGAALASTAAMERWLASLPREPAVVRVGTRAAVMGLEDRIAQVDDLLSAERLEEAPPARLQALQRERTRLVGTLVQVRYAETLAQESR